MLQFLFDLYLKHTDRTFLFIAGDEQVFTLVWMLKNSNSIEYKWVISIAGEWHWTWHILKAIFRI